MNITTNCNRTSHWLNIRFFHQYFPCLCKIKRKVIRSKNCGISQKKKDQNFRSTLLLNLIHIPCRRVVWHLLLKAVCTVWAVRSSHRFRVPCEKYSSKTFIGFGRWRLVLGEVECDGRLKRCRCPFVTSSCHVTLQIISLRRVDKLEIVFVLL